MPFKKMEKIQQNGKCNTCLIEVEDINYVFCSIECRDVWIWLKEKNMGQYDIDKDLYIKWSEEKLIAIEQMTTREEIEARIIEISKIEFFAKREWAMLHQQYDKITGRKGIAPWLKGERDKLITDPNIKVDWEGEPRKKEKKPKEDMVKNLLGFDIKELTKNLKENNKPAKKESAIDMTDIISQIANASPKVETPKASQDEIKAKADALKERMRLAKEKKESGQ